MTRIVIVGGGPAGVNTAQALAKTLKPTDDVEVVMLEKSKFYYHAVGAPRAYTEAAFTNKMFIPYDNAIPKAAAGFVKIVRGIATAVSAESNEVTYTPIDAMDKPASTAETLKFDYLVFATGSTYTVPIKQHPSVYSRSHTEAQLQQVRDHVAKADKILIVGGGAVGCEVAGDIAVHYPNKTVTILEGKDKLIATNELRDKFRTYLTNAMEKRKIKVILGERLEEKLTGNSFQPRTLTTDKGTVIESDVQLLCGGFSPAAELLSAMDPSVIDDKGAVKVNSFLQVDDDKYRHIFALGDVSNHPTPKLAYWASEQAKYLARELVPVLRKTQEEITKPFPAVTVEALILPLGPNGGVSQLPVWGASVVGDIMTRTLKSKDMFTGRMWGSLNASPSSAK